MPPFKGAFFMRLRFPASLRLRIVLRLRFLRVRCKVVALSGVLRFLRL
jgi:hypothetical protein